MFAAAKHVPACIIALALLALSTRARAMDAPAMLSDSPAAGDVPLVRDGTVADIHVDTRDTAVVGIAAKLLSEDIKRVTGTKPAVKSDAASLARHAILIGTIGKSPLIDALIESGKLDVSRVRGKWESALIATIDHPLANVDSALVIAGSDRRGTAFGVFELSEQAGVSPWYWWADVTPDHRDALTIKSGSYVIGPPSVKYRGIFINDEDWGLRPWASKTFDPQFGNIGPKTYERVFELLLRLKANYLWPGMHPDTSKTSGSGGTREFGTVDENIKLADDWAIVMGASHAEPMNRNNVAWDTKTQGEWRYDTNRDAIYKYWEEWAKKRGPYEATWTIGLRGIHDSAMQGPKDTKDKVFLLEAALTDQRLLLAKYVNPKIESVPQIFCPYKEVLTLYRAGLKVPDDVTLVWPDDNHGYIRQLSSAQEQKRSGGSGVYYHLSYWGKPEDFLWLCTTPPALVWEEMTKAYDNDARNLWVVNVGDIKPMEIGMEFFLTLARNVRAWDENVQLKFLADWATRNFGASDAAEIAAVMDEYYRLNFAVRPEHLAAIQLSSESKSSKCRLARFARLVERTDALNARVKSEKKDAFYETVVYPIRCSALMNQKWLSDSPDAAKSAHEQIQVETKQYNETIAGGKWRNMMSAAPRQRPVFLKSDSKKSSAAPAGWAGVADGDVSIEAELPTRQAAQDGTAWKVIAGLGLSGDSIALLPASASVADASKLEYDFTVEKEAPAAKVSVYCVPTHAIRTDLKVRYAVRIDGAPAAAVDLESKEFSPEWSENVLHAAAIGTTEHKLMPGKHTLTLAPLDPGMVFDKIVINFEK